MSRFYLHISDREQSIPDIEGIECDGILAARHEALRVIAELIDSGLWAPNSHSGRLITIADELGNVMDIVASWEITSRLVL
ncbi:MULTISPECIES: hypothetical protein [unclassified Devosia]|uniref:DUF6894 family protein n=1 Tax=unclassified Devosia TaxID=196773 RepID=UPI0009650887|nr:MULTISPECIES: hypothetical protein [unclassified Devosia]MBN9365364.1 hypothetical protein [Devosia sp.]OJX20343.1 MAG: hypothetical protein BGO83_04960 [Devosia sp. 66-14]